MARRRKDRPENKREGGGLTGRPSAEPRRILGFMHLKDHTKGTSNEVSFSVLDAYSKGAAPARDGLPFMVDPTAQALSQDGKSSVDHAASSSSSTSSATAAPSTISSAVAPKTSRRSHVADTGKASGLFERNPSASEDLKRRRRRRRRVALVSVLVVLGLAGVSAVGGYTYYREVLRKAEYSQEALRPLLEKLLKLDDSVLVPLDRFVTSGYRDTSTDEMKALRAKVESARTELRELHARLEKLTTTDLSQEERAVAGEALKGVVSRETMLKTGLDLLTLRIDETAAEGHFTTLWQDIHAADDNVHRATALVDKTDDEGRVKEATRLLAEAKSKLDEAKAELSAIDGMADKPDMAAVAAYLDARSAAVGYALGSNEAIQDQNPAKAEADNAAANEAEAKAAELARALPANPGSFVADSYAPKVAAARDAYLAARKEAARSDSTVRDYLKR